MYAYCHGQSAGKILSVSSTGSTQEELLDALKAKLTIASENEKRWELALNAVAAVIVAQGALLIIIGFLVAESFVVAIGGVVLVIAAAFAAFVFIVSKFLSWIFSSDLASTIKDKFPSSKF